MNKIRNKITDEILRKIRLIHFLIAAKIRFFIKSYTYGVYIDKHCIIEKDVEFNTLYGGTISIGKNCALLKGCQILTYGGNIFIGNNCSINPYTIIYGQGNVTIGNGVRIAAHCIIIPSNHIFSEANIPIYEQGLENKGIIIEDDVWIGSGVRILDGITIARGCVIGAGSVVTKSTEAYGIYVGVPARKIKSRNYKN